MPYCHKCKKELYYTGGCTGEWEHIGDCPAEQSDDASQAKEPE